MANRTVTLIRICKTEKGWRRYPVAFGKNGRIRPGWVMVGEEPESCLLAQSNGPTERT